MSFILYTDGNSTRVFLGIRACLIKTGYLMPVWKNSLCCVDDSLSVHKNNQCFTYVYGLRLCAERVCLLREFSSLISILYIIF